ncbi:hypothetical protein RFI_16198 [Reticulomyxa filosa]|uniref:Uncharacterized protein n=1 Tax=Reticulomyxa filosa TaxID=46433 RepID=X6N4Q8_RETFI|nr:hypothetical protein RFI_16198 [Reticulomyxa filosa]|eukprot:ETO21006.1 hypothetical protein RFI_16198 [Reticulomyxa filosa]
MVVITIKQNDNCQDDAQANADENDTLDGQQEDGRVCYIKKKSRLPNKRRKSQKLDEELRNTDEAKMKRQARQEKEHNRQESGAVPKGLFESDYANTEEARKIREERAKKARKESVAIPKNLFASEHDNNSEDDATREERRIHQRKQSLMKAVGDKGHLSDEDTEKSKNAEYEARRKVLFFLFLLTVDRAGRQKGKEAAPIPEKTEIFCCIFVSFFLPIDQYYEKVTIIQTHHRRESSLPVPNLGFDDPTIIIAETKEEVQNLKERLKKLEEEKKAVEKQLQESKEQAQQLEKRVEEKVRQEKSGSNNKNEIEQMTVHVEELKKQLNHTADSKLKLIQRTNNEINRLKLR